MGWGTEGGENLSEKKGGGSEVSVGGGGALADDLASREYLNHLTVATVLGAGRSTKILHNLSELQRVPSSSDYTLVCNHAVP